MDILDWLAANAEAPIIVVIMVWLYARLQGRHWKTQDDCTARERALLDRILEQETETGRLSHPGDTGQDATH